jgi:Zn-dependent protease
MLDQLSLGNLIIVLVSLIISVSIHEAMHAYTSHWLGDNTASREGRITLNPLKHIDIFLTIIMPIITLLLFKVPLLAAKPVPFNPSRVKYEEFGAAMVGFAGPLTNIILAALAAGVINTFQGALSIDVLQALGIFMMINIGLFVFNMMPIPPLDGSRVLYAFAPEPLQRFMASLEQIGIFIVFALVLAVPAFSTLLVELNRDILNFLLR